MEFRLLGPVGLWDGERRLGPAAAQQRTVLASLLLETPRVVPVDRLMTALWGATPPASARNALHGRIHGVRRLLDACPGAELRTSEYGYGLQVKDVHCDLHRFRELARAARQGGPEAAELLRAALAHWHGPALADVSGSWLASVVAPGLEEERLQAMEELAVLDLRAGRHQDVVERLTPVFTENIPRERAAVLLLSALHRSGRRVDALALYRRVRTLLVEELGIEPGEELQRVHQEALDGAPDPHAPPGPGEAGTAEVRATEQLVPRQLPPDTEHFTGREAELAALDALLGARAGNPSGLVVIGGIGGVGKTALAVHWAHRVAERFPDGQLYVNLRGFDPADSPVPATEALRMCLGALNVPQHRLPETFEQQTGLYRTLLADRRVLVLLDNARDAAQIRPLLPGSPGCTVLVTSRHELTGLIAAEGAHPLPLDLFTADQSRELMARRLGAETVAEETGAVDALVSLCSGLPLSLAIVAARALTRPGLPLAGLLPEPDGDGSPLDAFEGGDVYTDLRAVFSWSYRALSEDAARLFRLLGRHEGPDIATAAAASLAGVPLPRARRLLGELSRAHLTAEHSPGHHVCHDLLWSYARELAQAARKRDGGAGAGAGLDTGGDGALAGPAGGAATATDAPVRRLVDHYLHTAFCGDRQLNLHHQIPVTVTPPSAGVTVTRPTGRAQALAWFRREHRSLVAAVRQADLAGLDTQCWQLARATRTFLYQQGHLADQLTMHRTALRAATRLADPGARAYCRFGMGQAQVRLARFDEARQNLNAALELYGGLEDRIGQAVVLTQHAVLAGRLGEVCRALRLTEEALDHCRAAGHRPGQVMALNNAGWYHAQLGQYPQALRYCQEALTVLEELGDVMGEAATLDSLGFVHLGLGEPEQAISYYERALALRRGQERVYEAETLPQLAEAQLAAGRVAEARDSLRRAVAMTDELAGCDDRLRARLAEVEELGSRADAGR